MPQLHLNLLFSVLLCLFANVTAAGELRAAIAPKKGAQVTESARSELPLQRKVNARSVVVEVVGYGSNVKEARSDGIRQAMQSVLSQLVVTERHVSGDEVLEDSVLSTMNGFIERVEEIEISHFGGETKVHSRITVSTEAIFNYLREDATGSGIDGLSLFSESERSSGNQAAHSEIFARAFRGFPGQSFETRISSIRPHGADPDKIEIEFEIQARPGWVKNFRDIISSLSSRRFNLTFAKSEDDQCRNDIIASSRILIGGYPKCMSDSARKDMNDAFHNEIRPNTPVFCLIDKESAECYLLPSGNYLGEFSRVASHAVVSPAEQKHVLLLVGIDPQGHNTFRNGCCSVSSPVRSGEHRQNPLGLAQALRLGGDFRIPTFIDLHENRIRHNSSTGVVPVNFIYLGPVKAKILAEQTEFDTAQTRKIFIAPAISHWSNSGALIFDIGIDGAQPSNRAIADNIVRSSANSTR